MFRQELLSIVRRILGTHRLFEKQERIEARLTELHSSFASFTALLQIPGNIEELRDGIRRVRRSMVEVLDRLSDIEHQILNDSDPGLRIVTDFPVAIHSNDHKHPRGTRNDNSRSPRFVRRVESIFGRKVTHVDLGCAGGGLVLDFLLAGHKSVGIEGSDYCLKEGRAEWRVIPNHLFTADITKPFHFATGDNEVEKFDLITAWEVLEHLSEADLPQFFENLKRNLKSGGLFVASVATFEDFDSETGTIYHVTVKPKEWWVEFFRREGFVIEEGYFSALDFVRGAGNPRLFSDDWDVAVNPSLGFHAVLRYGGAPTSPPRPR